jgi:hypothetical protein
MRDTFARLAWIVVVMMACGPGRTTFLRHPAGATTFDRNSVDAKALAIADRVVSAAGGMERWSQVKQLRWTMSLKDNGKVVMSLEQAWDRWNGRHHARLHNVLDVTNAVETSHNPTQSVREAAGDVVVMRRMYEESNNAYFDTGRGLRTLDLAQTQRATATARERWEADSVALCIPFLLEEPGTRLEYAGEQPGEAGKPLLDDLKVTLDPKDTTRTASYHVLVNRETNMIDRLDIVPAGKPDSYRIAFRLSQWVDVNGLKFATLDENIAANGEVIAFQRVATSTEPEDALYIPVAQ